MGFLRLFARHHPKIKFLGAKKDGFSGWIKCTRCEEMIHANELRENLNCCPKCNHHYRLDVIERVELLADEDSFEELFAELIPSDPLEFKDSESYQKRIEKAQKKSGRNEGVLTGTCLIEKLPIALAILDFNFMGGSMGSVVGEKITLMIEYAIKHHLPLVIVSSSGGARMQESIFSLMQMAKTSAALAKLSQQGLPYISVLTNPTTGGITASFASLGDIIIAEPEALIGFAGPRVVEQTIRQKLPDTAQRSEFLLEKGMIDCIVMRSELKKKIACFIEFLTEGKSVEKASQLTRDPSVDSDRNKLDELIALSQRDREKNRINVTTQQ